MRENLFLLRLALRNMTRHKRRTLITASVISAALFIYIAMDSHLASMDEMSYDNIIEYESGHLQLVTPEYWEEKDDMPLEHLIAYDDELASAVGSVRGVSGAVRQLDFPARLNDGIDELPVIGRGIDPVAAGEVFRYRDHFVEGGMFAPGENRVVMGKALADLMGLGVGDFVILLVRTREEYFNTIDAEIAGLLHTPNPLVNEYVVFTPLDTAQDALGVQGQASRIIVRLDDRGATDAAASELRESLSGYPVPLSVIPWHSLEAVSVSDVKNIGNQLILSIILLIAAIGIINSVILSSLERMPEIGMMKSFGLRERGIVSIFVMESTGIAVLGGAAGCALGAGAVALLVRYGIDYTAWFGDMSQFGIPIIGPIYGVWNPESFIKVFFFAVVISMFSSIFPALWAARKDPVAALYGGR